MFLLTGRGLLTKENEQFCEISDSHGDKYIHSLLGRGFERRFSEYLLGRFEGIFHTFQA
jgi:hypothetical protein